MIYDGRMEYVLRVSSKGQIVIPAEVRRKFNIRSKVILKVEGGEIKLIPLMDLRDAFGIDGDKMIEVARLLLNDKKREIELEK